MREAVRPTSERQCLHCPSVANAGFYARGWPKGMKEEEQKDAEA